MWIQSVNVEHFLGTIQYLFRARIPSPTACMRELLRFSQIVLTSHQSFLGALAFDELTDLAADGGHHVEQLLIGLPDLAAEKLDHAQEFAPEQDRKADGRV